MSRIIVADDEEHIASLISDCLIVEGYEVDTANNGLLAYRFFQDTPYDLVITDIIMPDMDGLELIQKIKKQRPQGKVIAMSAGGDRSKADIYLEPAQMFGADQRLNKPFDLDELVEKCAH